MALSSAARIRCFERFAMKKFSPTIIVLLFCVLSGCSSTQGPETLDPVPLTKEVIDFLKSLNDPKTTSVIEDVPKLFFDLNQLLNSWYESSLFKMSKKHIRIHTSLDAMLTRRVYLNFDKILDQLENGSQPNRVIAAAALGFSRIPDDERFPQVYPRAIEALILALDSGDDAIIENALLGLSVLEEFSTPKETILQLMTQHHNPAVRANAALCLSAIILPSDADLVMPHVLPALKDDEPKVRNHAVSIILELQSPGAVTPLIELLTDRYDLIRANAARALGVLGEISACGALISQLDNPKEIVRYWSLDSLKKLSGEDYGDEQERWTEWWNAYRLERGQS